MKHRFDHLFAAFACVAVTVLLCAVLWGAAQ